MIVICGEALIDLVPTRTGDAYEARPGGGPLNVAVGLGRLGVDVALLARLAADRLGRVLREHLRASRVGLDLIVPSAAPTTLAVLGLDPAGVAAYDFYIDGCADGGWRADQLPDELAPGGALHVAGSLALPVPGMGDALEVLLVRERARRVITFDPNIRPSLVRDGPPSGPGWTAGSATPTWSRPAPRTWPGSRPAGRWSRSRGTGAAAARPSSWSRAGPTGCTRWARPDPSSCPANRSPWSTR